MIYDILLSLFTRISSSIIFLDHPPIRISYIIYHPRLTRDQPREVPHRESLQ
jgi:hypothetical protein